MNDKAYKFSTRDSTEFTVGSGLPEVTSEDNGDVLTVVEGAWAKAAPADGGGTDSGIMVVEADVDGNDNITLKSTWQEIFNAMKDGMLVLVPIATGEIAAAMYFIKSAVSSAVSGDGAYVVDLSAGFPLATLTPDGYPSSAALDESDGPGAPVV